MWKFLKELFTIHPTSLELAVQKLEDTMDEKVLGETVMIFGPSSLKERVESLGKRLDRHVNMINEINKQNAALLKYFRIKSVDVDGKIAFVERGVNPKKQLEQMTRL